MKSNPQQSDAVEIEIRIEARSETVFPFLTDPQKMLEWMGKNANLDPVPGGIFHVGISDDNIARGEYVEITPNSRVVFTWGWEGQPVLPGSSTVEITIPAELLTEVGAWPITVINPVPNEGFSKPVYLWVKFR